MAGKGEPRKTKAMIDEPQAKPAATAAENAPPARPTRSLEEISNADSPLVQWVVVIERAAPVKQKPRTLSDIKL